MKIERPLQLQECTYTLGELNINIPKQELQYQNEKIRLCKKEAELLEFLLRNQGRVVNRLTILEFIWNHSVQVNTNTLEVHMASLRRKLKKLTQHKVVQTIYGLGYRLIIPSK